MPPLVQAEAHEDAFHDEDRKPAVSEEVMVAWRIAVGTNKHAIRRIVGVSTPAVSFGLPADDCKGRTDGPMREAQDDPRGHELDDGQADAQEGHHSFSAIHRIDT